MPKKRKRPSESDDDDDLLEDMSYDSANSKLFRIEKNGTNSSDTGKRHRRLLQNRKSALKCRLKKMGELDCMKGEVEDLADQNKELAEKVKASF